MKKSFYLIILQAMIFTGCSGQQEQLNCFNNYVKTNEKDPLFGDLKNGLTDTLNVWINKRIKKTKIFQQLIWHVDEAIFISPEKDKAIMLILEQDTAKYISKDLEPDRSIRTSFDYVELIYANKEIDGWHYYYQSMPSMVIPRPSNNKENPISFENLSEIGRNNVLKDYYEKGTCKYNTNFFDRWNILNLKEKHHRFIINDY